MDAFIIGLVTSHPTIATILLVMATARSVMKPVMVGIEKYVLETPDKSDDEKLAKVEKHWAYRALVFVLDYSLSIKLPK